MVAGQHDPARVGATSSRAPVAVTVNAQTVQNGLDITWKVEHVGTVVNRLNAARAPAQRHQVAVGQDATGPRKQKPMQR